MKSKHGACSAQARGDVLHVVLEGSVTLDLMQALHREAAQFWLARDGRPWALYSDLLDFEASPPDALDEFWGMLDEAIEHGLIAATDVRRPDHFRVSKAEQVERLTRRIKFQISASEPEAMQWLGALGLRTD